MQSERSLGKKLKKLSAGDTEDDSQVPKLSDVEGPVWLVTSPRLYIQYKKKMTIVHVQGIEKRIRRMYYDVTLTRKHSRSLNEKSFVNILL